MVIRAVQPTPELPLRGYLEWGREGIRSTPEGWDMREWAQDVYDALEGKGVTMEGGEVPESLDWKSWRNRTHVLLGSLFPPR